MRSVYDFNVCQQISPHCVFQLCRCSTFCAIIATISGFLIMSHRHLGGFVRRTFPSGPPSSTLRYASRRDRILDNVDTGTASLPSIGEQPQRQDTSSSSTPAWEPWGTWDVVPLQQQASSSSSAPAWEPYVKPQAAWASQPDRWQDSFREGSDPSDPLDPTTDHARYMEYK